MSEAAKPDLTTLTVQLLSAYVANNAVPSNDLADLIRKTRAALAEGEGGAAEAAPLPPQPEYVPAVSVHTSVASRDHIVSLIDGKPYKSLKRHLSAHGLTAAEYRERYDLPEDYPLVAPGYSEERREAARRLGLGRKKVEAAPQAEAAAETSPPVAEVESEPAPARKRATRAKASAPSEPRPRRTRKEAQPAVEQAVESVE